MARCNVQQRAVSESPPGICHGWARRTPDSPPLLTHRYSGSGSPWPISHSPISLSGKKKWHLFAPLRKVCFVTWDVRQNSKITPNESSPFLTSSWVWVDLWLARKQETMTKVVGEVLAWLGSIVWQRWQVVALTVIHCIGPSWQCRVRISPAEFEEVSCHVVTKSHMAKKCRVVSRDWQWSSAENQQENGKTCHMRNRLSPTTTWACKKSSNAGRKTAEWHVGGRYGGPEQRAQTGCAQSPERGSCGKMNSYLHW